MHVGVDSEDIRGVVLVGIERNSEVLLEIEEDRTVCHIVTAFGAADIQHVVHEVHREINAVVVAVIIAFGERALDKSGLEIIRTLVSSAGDIFDD